MCRTCATFSNHCSPFQHGTISSTTPNDTVSSDLVGQWPENFECYMHVITFTNNLKRYNCSVAIKSCAPDTIDEAL